MPNFSLFEAVEFSSKSEWDGFRLSAIVKSRSIVESGLIKHPLPNKFFAYCGCCGAYQDMDVSARLGMPTPDGGFLLAFSETSVCPECRINSRMRFACELLREKAKENSNVQIYLTERKTFLFDALIRQGFDCKGSEWLGSDKKPGVVYEGVEHQDIHDLTYSDESIDVVMSLDVLEHVNDPWKAITELYRVLAADGLAIVTFPFFADRENSTRRAWLNNEGEVEHLEAAVYHGNPLGGGSLVFTDFAWDFIEKLQIEYEKKMSFINYWSVYGGHFGRSRFALLLRK